MNLKVNTIIFDLDGTLLPMNLDKFMKIYFDEMSNHFKDIISPKKLIDNIWASTRAMVTNTEDKTNEEVFMSDFSKRIDENLECYLEEFDKFYDNGFLKTKDAVEENDLVKKSINMLKDKGYNLVLATNPLFPKKAILHRIKWANLDANDFTYITSYENNHYCKPQIKFYEEVLSDIGKTPNECIMVGNDVQEDLIAGNLGIKTYLIKDHIIHRTDDEIAADYIGDYNKFHEFVKNLPIIK